MTRSDYARFLKEWTNLPPVFEFHSQTFDLGTIAFYDSGRFKSGLPIPLDGRNTYDVFRAKDDNQIFFYANGHSGLATFYDDDAGSLQSVAAQGALVEFHEVPSSDGYGNIGRPRLSGDCFLGDPGRLGIVIDQARFYEDAAVARISLRPSANSKGLVIEACAWASHATETGALATGDLEFYANGLVKTMTLGTTATFRKSDGSSVEIPAGGHAKFDAEGWLAE